MTEHGQNIEDQNRDDQISDPTKEDQISDPAPEDLDQETDLDQTEDTDLDTEQDSEQTEQDSEPDPRVASARKEAAKYRQRAQQAEADRDTAVEMMTNVSRSAVNLMLDAYEVKHDFIWSGGYSPLGFFEADGILNRQKVVEAIKEQEAKLGVKACSQYAYRNGAYEPTTPSIRGGSPGQYGPPPSTGSWSDALRG